MRIRLIESMAQDVERFDPDNSDHCIDDYLGAINLCLSDIPDASTREKLRLIWKTTSKSVRNFTTTLQPEIRCQYSALCNALRQEYSTYIDPASALLSAFSVLHQKHEAPKDYYWRLRSAYFQGRKAPGLEENQTFKSIFMHNLHGCVRSDVTLHSRTHQLSMKEIKKFAQVVWQTCLCHVTREGNKRPHHWQNREQSQGGERGTQPQSRFQPGELRTTRSERNSRGPPSLTENPILTPHRSGGIASILETQQCHSTDMNVS
ncbi:uncharacterized protein LOC132954661 [Labrus mixtus]|uniref:uncharacterized protein LOC132954661 n=1 Tax=Labrus mixtus TaxID=508554 RepID=UPI0029BFAF02|nr:uncharacterized protein LOC132954661 [Labrus mixtus]